MTKNKISTKSKTSNQKGHIAPIFSRFKAFVIDMFLIATPLLYVTTYLILNGKDDFQQSQVAIATIWLIYGIITSLFFAKTAQTPGSKAQNIYVITLDGRKSTFSIYLIRYALFIAGFIIGGSLFCLFRKDKRNLHDILTNTIVIEKISSQA